MAVALMVFVAGCGTEMAEYNNAKIQLSANSVAISGEGAERGIYSEASFVDARGQKVLTSSSDTSAQVFAEIKCEKCVCNLTTKICDCTGCTIQ
jgi:hypothetical protein